MKRDRKISVKFSERVDKHGDTSHYIKVMYNKLSTNFKLPNSFFENYSELFIKDQIVKLIKYAQHDIIDFSVTGFKDLLEPCLSDAKILFKALGYFVDRLSIGDVVSYNEFIQFFAKDYKSNYSNQNREFLSTRIFEYMDKHNLELLTKTELFEIRDWIVIEQLFIGFHKEFPSLTIDWFISEDTINSFMDYLDANLSQTIKEIVNKYDYYLSDEEEFIKHFGSIVHIKQEIRNHLQLANIPLIFN